MGSQIGAALAKLPWYGQVGVFVGLSLIGAGAFYYFYESPQQTAFTARRAELADVQERVRRGQEMARRLPEFRQQVADLEARMEVLKPILPTDRDAGDLLRRVQTLAVQSNLTILGFRPQAITVNELHAEWPISLQLEGSYHNLGLFLDRVSKFPRIINIGGLTLAQKEPSTASASMTINCTATTFVLVEPPPAPPAAPAKKGKKGAAKGPAKK